MQNKETFSYTYSSKQQEEVKKIREKYLPKKADKMEQLRRLDASVTKKGMVISLIVGIIGTLILETGMSMCMVWTELFVWGIMVGIIGIVAVSLAYPLYSYVIKRARKKIAPEII